MNIPTEILEKYHLTNRALFDTDLDFYKEFLKCTDHIPNRIVEQLVEDLADATPLNILESFIKFIAAVRLEYREVLQCRKNAREKINELEKVSDV